MDRISKQDILDAIRRTAKENGGAPLGVRRFEKDTGIKPYDISRYWARFSDAQQEAGFSSNALSSAYDMEFLLEKIIALMRELGRYPTDGDLLFKSNRDPNFPSTKPFRRLGNKKDAAKKIYEYAAQKGYDDILELCKKVIENSKEKEDENVDNSEASRIGEVYLFKSGRYYKIGKTNDTVRRGQELRIQLPEKMDLVHSIKTDDPSGVEAYWHRRFDAKRMNGEWFDLNSADVKSFKRWRCIV